MTKSLQEIQQENRRLILEAVHGVSYEEALEKDEKSLSQNSFFSNGLCLIREYIRPENFYKGLGKPITLSRVLLALEKQFKNEYHKMIFQDGQLFFICAETPVCQFYWRLEKETLEEQSEETQRQINKLLNNEQH